MASIAKCEECGFQVPWDEIGAAIMQQHLLGHNKTPVSASVKLPPDIERIEGKFIIPRRDS